MPMPSSIAAGMRRKLDLLARRRAGDRCCWRSAPAPRPSCPRRPPHRRPATTSRASTIEGLIRDNQRARRGARAAGQVARQGRDRAHRQPRRHHRRLRAALRFAARACRPRSRWWWWSTGWPPPAAISPRMSADHIVAQDTSLVGSIGVLFQYPNFTELLKTLGVKVERSNPRRSRPRPTASSRPARRRAPPSRRSCAIPMPGSKTW